MRQRLSESVLFPHLRICLLLSGRISTKHVKLKIHHPNFSGFGAASSFFGNSDRGLSFNKNNRAARSSGLPPHLRPNCCRLCFKASADTLATRSAADLYFLTSPC